jgi:hypothetical protein
MASNWYLCRQHDDKEIVSITLIINESGVLAALGGYAHQAVIVSWLIQDDSEHLFEHSDIPAVIAIVRYIQRRSRNECCSLSSERPDARPGKARRKIWCSKAHSILVWRSPELYNKKKIGKIITALPRKMKQSD